MNEVRDIKACDGMREYVGEVERLEACGGRQVENEEEEIS